VNYVIVDRPDFIYEVPFVTPYINELFIYNVYYNIIPGVINTYKSRLDVDALDLNVNVNYPLDPKAKLYGAEVLTPLNIVGAENNLTNYVVAILFELSD